MAQEYRVFILDDFDWGYATPESGSAVRATQGRGF